MRMNFDKSPISEKKKEDYSDLCGKVILIRWLTFIRCNVDKHLCLMKSNSAASPIFQGPGKSPVRVYDFRFRLSSCACCHLLINYPSVISDTQQNSSFRGEIVPGDFRRVRASLFALLRPINLYKLIYRHGAIARGEVTLSDVDCYQWIRCSSITHIISIYRSSFRPQIYNIVPRAHVASARKKMHTNASRRCGFAWQTEAKRKISSFWS